MAKRIVREGNTDPSVAVVKKYANRRLYNTQSSSYVTLEELSAMVRDGKEFLVYDAKTGDDITRSVLTQIILEEDSKGRNLLPIGFLRQLIGFYDDSLHAVLPKYLEVAMENFAHHQDHMRSYMEGTFTRFFPMAPGATDVRKPFEDLTRQNIAMLQSASRMFNPFAEQSAQAAGVEPAADDGPEPQAPPPGPRKVSASPDAQVEELKAQMAELQARINKLDTDRG